MGNMKYESVVCVFRLLNRGLVGLTDAEQNIRIKVYMFHFITYLNANKPKTKE